MTTSPVEAVTFGGVKMKGFDPEEPTAICYRAGIQGR